MKTCGSEERRLQVLCTYFNTLLVITIMLLSKNPPWKSNICSIFCPHGIIAHWYSITNTISQTMGTITFLALISLFTYFSQIFFTISFAWMKYINFASQLCSKHDKPIPRKVKLSLVSLLDHINQIISLLLGTWEVFPTQNMWNFSLRAWVSTWFISKMSQTWPNVIPKCHKRD